MTGRPAIGAEFALCQALAGRRCRVNPDSDPSTLTTAAIRRWSTDAVPTGQRLDYWIGAICEGFLEMEATSPSAARFHSSLESARLGGIGVNRVRGSAQDVYRSAGAIAKSRENH